MALHGEFAWHVIQLFTDVFANTLKLATAGALSAFWLVVDQRARSLHHNRPARLGNFNAGATAAGKLIGTNAGGSC